MTDLETGRAADEAIRLRAFELSQGLEAGTPVENWLRAERELAIEHGYDTVDRDLEQLGIRITRVPLEAGVLWRLHLPRGEQVEAWEPGNDGLAPPAEIARLIDTAVAGKPLVPGPPLPTEPGAVRLREMIETQRRELLRHDPGTRLGGDPESLHQHRVAARRTRAFLRATKKSVDPSWRRGVSDALGELGCATGPVRDLDVLLEHVREQVAQVGDEDRAGARLLVASLEQQRASARARLLAALDGDGYRLLLRRLRLPPRLAEGVEAVRLEHVAKQEFRRLAKAVRRLGEQPHDGEVHSLRIQLKRARYAAELAPPGAGQARRRRFLDEARSVQDLLGEYQDAAVAETQLRAATVFDGATAAAFVAGRLAERQVARRDRVSARLPAAWKRLRRSGKRLH